MPPPAGTVTGPCSTVPARKPAAAARSAAASWASISAAVNAGLAIFSPPATLPAGSVSRKLLSCWLPSGCARTVRPNDSAIRSASWIVTCGTGSPPCRKKSTPANSGDEDNPAYRAAVGQPLEPGGPLGKTEPLGDQRPDRAVRDELGQLRVAVPDELGVLALVQAPVQAHDRV